MAYCNNCGAYIPDGQSKCLACGLDETEEKAKAAETEKATASATQSAPDNSSRFDSEYLRRQLEEQRQRQRENSRKWAEAEFARRQSQQEKKSESYVNREARQKPKMGAALPNKTFAALSYLGILCLLPMFLCPGDEFAMFHARQGLGLFLVGLACNVLSGILGFGWLVTLAWFYMIYKGVTTAAAGERKPLPYIGNLFLKK